MDIIISGYPKSGNTWTARLIAECLNSPVVGYYNEPENNEIAIEGLDRTGKFRVFKSHDLKSNILKTNPAATIITIRRDPRERLASAYRFFKVRSYWSKYPGNQHFPLKQFYKLLDITFPWKRNNKKRILHAFVKGDWRFLGLIAFSTVVDYFVGLHIDAAAEKRTKKQWLAGRISTISGIPETRRLSLKSFQINQFWSSHERKKILFFTS